MFAERFSEQKHKPWPSYKQFVKVLYISSGAVPTRLLSNPVWLVVASQLTDIEINFMFKVSRKVKFGCHKAFEVAAGLLFIGGWDIKAAVAMTTG